MKFVVLHRLPNGQVEIVGFRLHEDRHEAALLAGILNSIEGAEGRFTMYEMTACASASPADVAKARAEL